MPFDSSLDPYAILQMLHVQTVHTVIPVTGGTDTALWRVEHEGKTSALRVFRPTQHATYQRELFMLNVVAHSDVPVPQVRAHGQWHDHPAILLSWCAGQPLATRLQRQPWQVLQLGRAFGQMQAGIHRVVIPQSAYQPELDWLRWHQSIDSTLERKLRQQAIASNTLLHLDYHPLNVLTTGTRISAVLDWANARVGDPRADVARTYTILVVEPHRPEPEPVWYWAARRILAWSWLNGYQSIAGKLRDMAPFFAWAGMVMQADLAPRVDTPDSWWQSWHLQMVQRWTQRWQERI